MSTQETVAVVGAGIMGLSTAWALQKRGYNVVIIEQSSIPNTCGTSFDEHRIIRHSYGSMVGYSKMIPPAYKAWNRMWKDLGVCHYLDTGAVYVVRGKYDYSVWLRGMQYGLKLHNLPCKEITLKEMEQKYPVINPKNFTRAFEVGGAGMLFASRIVTSLAEYLGKCSNVTLLSLTKVTQVDYDAGVISAVSASSGKTSTIKADHIVVAAGSWAPSFVAPSARPQITASRQQVLYLKPPADLEQHWQTTPIIIEEYADGLNYTLPPRDGTRLKLGDHGFSLQGHPDDSDRGNGHIVRGLTDELQRAEVYRSGSIAYRDFDRYTVDNVRNCFYTVAPDERFVMKPLGQRAWLLSACSGHGFKFGALLGEGMADAVQGKRSAAEMERWAAGREGDEVIQSAL